MGKASERLLLYLKNKFIGRYGYGYSIIYLKQAFADINLVKTKGKKLTIEEVKSHLTLFCTYLKNLYAEKLNSTCCVSIHLFTELEVNESMFTSSVKNFVRDKDANRNDLNYKKHVHSVYNNTCFEEIVRNLLNKNLDKLYYINNDLPSDLEYKSTSLKVKENQGSKFDPKKVNNIRHRRNEWYLSYRSEIVLPLIPSKDHDEYYLLGFLCIDCQKEKGRIFNSDYDVPLLQGVIDGIYDIIYNNADLIYSSKKKK